MPVVYNTNARDRAHIAHLASRDSKVIQLSPATKRALINKMTQRLAKLQALLDDLRADEVIAKATTRPL